MRCASLVVLLLLSACSGTYSSMSSPGVSQQTAESPASGSDARRDGFYDGGIYDPDLTRRNLPLSQ